MKVCKCFYCGKDILTIEAEYFITDSERREFYKKYKYVKHLVGKIGKRLICNECREDLHELISENIRDTVIDMDVD